MTFKSLHQNILLGSIGTIFFLFLLLNTSTQAYVDKDVQLRFLIAHQPDSVFEESNVIFAERLNELSDGSLSLEVFNTYAFGENPQGILLSDVYDLMRTGKIDISTTKVANFSKEVPQAILFKIPFLFNDYASLDTFFNSKEGDALLDSISDITPIRALTYTFSGGFYNIVLKEEVTTSISSLQDLSVITSATDNEFSRSMFQSLGINPIFLKDKFKGGKIAYESADTEALETTYTRLSILNNYIDVGSVIETKHNALVTTIIVKDTVFESLSEKQKLALIQAARESASIEREASINLAQKTRSELIDNGVTIIQLSDEERAAFYKAQNNLYQNYELMIGNDILQSITDQRN